MADSLEQAATEINRLQRCINDLVSVTALPAIWAGGDQSQVVGTLLDAIMGMLTLDVCYVRLNDSLGGLPFETVRGSRAITLALTEREMTALMSQWLQDDATQSRHITMNLTEDSAITLSSSPIGLQGEMGVLVAGSQRPDFPTQIEQLVLSVALNQVAIGLQGARLLEDQRRVTVELDRLIGARTRELAETENNFRRIVDSIPGLLCTMNSSGVTERINRPLMDYFGKSFEDLQNWTLGDAVHPEDLPREITAFTHSIMTGSPFHSEVRLRRADGVYRWFQNNGLPVREAEGGITGWYFLLTDIDDRKRAEEALQARERDLNQIINTIPTLVWSARPDGSADFFSQRWLDFTGLSTVEAKDWGWTVAIHPDDATGLATAWQNIMASEEAGESEARLRRFDGEYRWFLFRANPLRDGAGKIVRWYGTNADIDDRKRAEQELRSSEARKTAILDSAIDCIMTIDHEGRIAEFNPAAERTFGYRREDVVGKYLADVIIPPSLRERHQQGLARYLATGEARVLGQRIEITAIRSDGSEFPVELSISRIPVDGAPSFTGYLRDITERKRAEEELQRSEAFLSEGQRLSRTGSFSWHVATGEVVWSEQVYRICEFDSDLPVTLQLFGSRVHPEDLAVIQDMVERAHAGKDFEYEHRLMFPDNRIKYVHVVAHGSKNKDGQWDYIGAVQDVTERRLSEEALSKVRSELTHMARVTSLGALTASIAHEVNQPLSGIVTNASTCLRMLAGDPPNIDGARETARRTIRDGKRASEVITRLRALFGKKEVTTELVDLNEAIREVAALSLSELQGNRVMMRFELVDPIPPVAGDRVQLQQVILNLLRNASDAMSCVDDRPRHLLIRTARDEGDCVRVSVQDTGVGIDPQEMNRLFDAFYTTKSSGMGMGLSVSRSIIESHRGRIWATLNDGPGTTFAFSIPHAPEGAQDRADPGAIQASAFMGTQNITRNP